MRGSPSSASVWVSTSWSAGSSSTRRAITPTDPIGSAGAAVATAEAGRPVVGLPASAVSPFPDVREDKNGSGWGCPYGFRQAA
ncbi:hypothetical protein ACFFX0_04955 [Citricoccus parietis]|uniref:Uncharacterized protein n=1 Tax=Citricoccus parietis TaxID=592307 RepID=A0ABV5FV70_9MICC